MTVIERELGCTLDDLARWMPLVAEGRPLRRPQATRWTLALAGRPGAQGVGATPGAQGAGSTPGASPVVQSAGATRVAHDAPDAGCAVVHLDAQVAPDRVIARLRLPVLRVQFRFDGADCAQQRRFLERFDLHTRRGGG